MLERLWLIYLRLIAFVLLVYAHVFGAVCIVREIFSTALPAPTDLEEQMFNVLERIFLPVLLICMSAMLWAMTMIVSRMMQAAAPK